MAVREANGLAVLEPLVEELGVLLLDMGGVAQHPVAEIDGGRSGEDGARKAVLDQGGEVAGMVDVSMRENHGIDGGSRERKIAILAVGVFAAALVHPAIEKKAPAAGFDQVHGAGDLAGRTPESKLHKGPW